MSFPLYLDEHVPGLLAKLLLQQGHDVLTTNDAGFAAQGYPDEAQLELASRHGRAILTYNSRDFVRIATEWHQAGRTHSGILLSPEVGALEAARRLNAFFLQHPAGIADLVLWL